MENLWKKGQALPRDEHESRLWGVAALLLWFGFFGVGLFPDFCYDYLRTQANVITAHAMVNSVFLLYAALVVYFFTFVSRAARAAGLSGVIAEVLAVQLSIVALVAFLPVVRLDYIPDYLHSPDPPSRRLALTACAFKALSWLYLLSLLCRYYLWSGGEVFRQMVPVFPSGRHEDPPAK